MQGKIIIKGIYSEDFCIFFKVGYLDHCGFKIWRNLIFFLCWLVEMPELFLSILEQNSRWEQTEKCYKTQTGCICQGAESGTRIFSTHQGLCSPHTHLGFIAAFSGLKYP